MDWAAYQRAWRRRNRLSNAASCAKWRARNPAKMAAARAKWNAKRKGDS